MATVNVTLSLSSTDLFAKQNLSFTETDILAPAGDQQLVGRLYTTGSGTEDGIATKAIAGTGQRCYVFLHNLSTTTGEYIKISARRAAFGTDSTVNDFFAQLGPGEFLFAPLSDMYQLDVEPATGNPVLEYVLMEKQTV
tara:strand:+ start:1138 stop:1554 length:417 start_codon:yes stop_codon:yes gene_type:complete